jgi:predicted transcriptional regulator
MSREGDVDESKRATLRRFAALGAASPLATFASDSDSEAPDALLGYLAATPGAHFSKIRDDLQLGTGEAQHHLRELERDSAVVSRKDGDYRRFYPAERFSEFEQVALGYLRRETPRGMIVSLLRRPDLSGADLARHLDVSRPTVSKHTAHLEAAGLLSRDDGYALQRPETLLMLLVRHADSFGADAMSLAADADDIVSVE